MGTIRTLLAIAVVFAHSYGFMFTGGVLAVQLFYIVSGYLMSTILINNENYNSISKFYTNRALRLFPVYWCVAFLSLILNIFYLYVGNDNFFFIYNELGIFPIIWLFFSNIFLIGQDWLMFTGVFDGTFGFTTDFQRSDLPIWEALLVPQAWTLGVEICFYLIAPFIIRNKKIWLSLLFISLFIKAYLIIIGLGTKDPFSYRFFPAELCLFLFGVFSHQFFYPFYRKNNIENNKILVNSAVILCIAYILLFHLIPINYFISSIVLIGTITLTLPLLASFQRASKIDNAIGNLSYPIYISHIMVINLIDFISEKYGFYKDLNYYILIFSITILFSILLEVFVNKKVSAIRRRIRGRSGLNTY